MSKEQFKASGVWKEIGPRFLPFADAASDELPLPRLLRLSLFQISVGMAVVLLTGTLNRVMIVELGIPASLVALMVAIPLVFAPLRALIGHRSDTHRSHLGWRRVPFIWQGTLLQFCGLAIMPFALLVLSGDTAKPVAPWIGPSAAALAFLLVGSGLHMTQTAGLALANDLAPEKNRPRVVAFLYVSLLVGMVASALVFGILLSDFSQLKLIQVIQGCAVVTLVLNVIAMWKQEARIPGATRFDQPRVPFREAWGRFMEGSRAGRLLVAVCLGTAGFSMQDVLLEPYGGEILNLSVSQTTALTAILAAGSLVGFALSAHLLMKGTDHARVTAIGILIGVFAFSTIIFAEPFSSAMLFRVGTFFVGLGAGLFTIGTITAAMALAKDGPDGRKSGLALGAWGAVQATAAGVGIAVGGILRDVVNSAAADGLLGPALTSPAAGYGVVYHLEIALLFASLVALGPLVQRTHRVAKNQNDNKPFGLAEFPG